MRERIFAEARGNPLALLVRGFNLRCERRSASAGVTVSGRSQRETIRRALEPYLFDVIQATRNLHERTPDPELASAHARGLRVYIKEALANGRLAGREPTRALEAAPRSAGTTPDALALAAVPARPWPT